jgi:hypothetical protein
MVFSITPQPENGSPHFLIVFDIDGDALCAVLVDSARGPPSLDRLGQHPLDPLLSNTLEPPGQRPWIDGAGKMSISGVLMILVLNPVGDGHFVRQPVSMLRLQ